jgi:hypothetical protein
MIMVEVSIGLNNWTQHILRCYNLPSAVLRLLLSSMEKVCLQCQQFFAVSDQDKSFYDSIGVPEPTLCPDCRQQRRLLWRNERKLYKRKSDLSGQEFVSVYSPDKPFVVYTSDEWWSDGWDPLSYGRPLILVDPFSSSMWSCRR